jgi:nitrite reductase/ring-hydroxylating ferredoxin subunit
MADIRTIARVADVPPGSIRRVELDGRPLALFNVDGRFYGVDDSCTHRGGPLSQGCRVVVDGDDVKIE